MSVSLPDFNTLRQMAEQNPAALERLRLEKINNLIESAPEAYRHRLRGLQFQIDAQRRIAKNPLQSCLNISRMMHDSFHKLREKLHEATQGNVLEASLSESCDRLKGAQIIAFPSPRG